MAGISGQDAHLRYSPLNLDTPTPHDADPVDAQSWPSRRYDVDRISQLVLIHGVELLGSGNLELGFYWFATYLPNIALLPELRRVLTDQYCRAFGAAVHCRGPVQCSSRPHCGTCSCYISHRYEGLSYLVMHTTLPSPMVQALALQ